VSVFDNLTNPVEEWLDVDDKRYGREKLKPVMDTSPVNA
jgi:hypothetical protein